MNNWSSNSTFHLSQDWLIYWFVTQLVNVQDLWSIWHNLCNPVSMHVFFIESVICWRMDLQMTKATTMQSCGQLPIRMRGWKVTAGNAKLSKASKRDRQACHRHNVEVSTTLVVCDSVWLPTLVLVSNCHYVKPKEQSLWRECSGSFFLFSGIEVVREWKKEEAGGGSWYYQLGRLTIQHNVKYKSSMLELRHHRCM